MKKEIKKVVLSILTIVIVGIGFTGCSGQKQEPFTQDEIKKTQLIKSKHDALLGTGYWQYVNYISVSHNSSGNPYFIFHMNNIYWSIKDSDTRYNITTKYRNMQRVFEKQLGLNKKISIATN